MIQISKLKGNKKQAKYDQKVITELKIKAKTNTKTTKTKNYCCCCLIIYFEHKFLK